MKYYIEPIGYVSKSNEGQIKLVVNDELWDATLEIHHFSHLIVLWWATERDNEVHRSVLQGTPPRIEGAKLSGVFATRSNARPNPICHTIVKLIEVDEDSHSLVIDHMDANDGTPIIDIKPYLPSSDRVDNAQVPPWFTDLCKRYTK